MSTVMLVITSHSVMALHQCLGQPLARLELNIAFSSLLSRIPTLQLAVPFEQIKFKEDVFIYGIEQLPVSWS